MIDRDEVSARVLKKWRELRRDLLYLKYGDEWRGHDRDGNFFDPQPSPEERLELEAMMAFAHD